jgi:hypothetical protein
VAIEPSGRATSDHLPMDGAAQPLAYYLHKDQLARGWSYPLKRSRLDDALIEAGVSNVASVFYSLVMTPLSERGTNPLTVQYGGEAVPSTHPGDVSIFVQSVRSDQRATIADGLEKVLGDIARWIAATKQREPTWRTESHSLYVAVVEGEATLREGPPR